MNYKCNVYINFVPQITSGDKVSTSLNSKRFTSKGWKKECTRKLEKSGRAFAQLLQDGDGEEEACRLGRSPCAALHEHQQEALVGSVRELRILVATKWARRRRPFIKQEAVVLSFQAGMLNLSPCLDGSPLNPNLEEHEQGRVHYLWWHLVERNQLPNLPI